MSKNNEEVVKVLNQQVANWTVAFTKLHNFHWYVKGPNFFSLHTKFEELYDEASQYIDDLAERILAVNGNPVATLKESLELSIIEEAGKDYTAEQMVEELSNDFDNISKQLVNAIEVASDAEDDVTEDMFIGMQTDIDKHNWMLKSYLGK
ncbi:MULTISPECIES: Dps family protein [Staphylococcus]|jgi:starvation-inducible DNA-binding protein|uniref:DNA starvation/stationary phase protection protein n=1 Tax=Staphylococcus nepalensis TaxID=214473 RepID=A0A291JJA4_9STAP|nr:MULTISPECIES: Dps family protein [Staphylococcus]ATH59573.1 DNA starvation/stationary phase protection protein [Staphylococcus nepalensis]ATH64664.1 DNA starvation/stationary phase protection protein [Staphylococcus nepalensis]AWI44020.1 DNA starvation/stationary phase protection protein [Staphylococcus nepalensis]MBO1206954.1 DNA starvation/stationary phase protection protein [Staphylococcus nepalensis]MBO1212932.1 DNA starvation/stationary phase protection protein [Staphylococcus nepalens